MHLLSLALPFIAASYVLCAPVPFRTFHWSLKDADNVQYKGLTKPVGDTDRAIVESAYHLANEMIIGMQAMVREARAYDLQMQQHRRDSKVPPPPANPVTVEKLRIVQTVFGMPSWNKDLSQRESPIEAILGDIHSEAIWFAQVSRVDAPQVIKTDPRAFAVTPWSQKGTGQAGPIVFFDAFYNPPAFRPNMPALSEKEKTAIRAAGIIHESIHQRRWMRDYYIVTSNNPLRGRMARSTERGVGEIKIRDYGQNKNNGYELDWRKDTEITGTWRRAVAIVEDTWNCPTSWQILASIWYWNYGPGSAASSSQPVASGSGSGSQPMASGSQRPQQPQQPQQQAVASSSRPPSQQQHQQQQRQPNPFLSQQGRKLKKDKDDKCVNC